MLEDIRTLIETVLSPLIDSDYVYLELPYYENPGDVLIWEGTEQFLSKLPYKCLYRASSRTFVHQELSTDTIILLQGGGNFGDLWNEPQEFRKKIVCEYPDNKIIILPQTVYYQDLSHAREDAVFFSLHKQLTVCARDKQSYRFLKLFGFSRKIHLCPDMALMIDPASLQQYVVPSTNKTIFVKRTDKELSSASLNFDEQYDVSMDWPTYMEQDEVVGQLYKLRSDRNTDRAEVDRFANEEFRSHMVKIAVEFISRYDKIITTRLHAGILAVILGKPVTILDNSYGKNSQFYNTWLKSYNGVRCLSSHSIVRISWSMIANAILSRIDRFRIYIGSLRRS